MERLGCAGRRPGWGTIVIAGRSDGADHAAFAAKTFPVARALAFAGANDVAGGPNPGVCQNVTPVSLGTVTVDSL